MRMMPCGHGPNARSQEITIHITTVGLAQARSNYPWCDRGYNACASEIV